MQPTATFEDFREIFIQPLPRYVRRELNEENWKNVDRPLFNKVVMGHLKKEYSIGVVSKWYPSYLAWDFDDMSLGQVEEHRDRLRLNDANSTISETESPDSYRVLCVPTYNGKPPTVNLLQSIAGPYARRHGFDVFPHPKKTLRLPYGPHQTAIEDGYPRTGTWEKELFWFQKLDEFPLESIPRAQMVFDFQPVEPGHVITTSPYKEGDMLFQYGLQGPSSREHSQFCVIYWLWRQNTSMADCFNMVWQWIRTKHNGYSKEIQRTPGEVKKHIKRQIQSIYNTYHFEGNYPDTPHRTHYGYIAHGDLEEIIKITKGNIPRSRFLFQLVKHIYPRKERMGVHSDKLRAWARSSGKYLQELESKGYLKRGTAWAMGGFPKFIKLNWRFKPSSEAFLYEGRPIDTFEGTVRHLKEPREFRDMLQGAGAERTTALKAAQRIYS